MIDSEFIAVQQKLLNNYQLEIASHKQLEDGRNSKVYFVGTQSAKNYALKIFFSRNGVSAENRHQKEVTFLDYLRDCNVKNCPKIIYADKINDNPWILMSWINGRKVEEINTTRLEEIATFIQQTNQQKFYQQRKNLGYAREACKSLTEFIDSIERRFVELDNIDLGATMNPEALEWISLVIRPVFEKLALRHTLMGTHWEMKHMNFIASQSDVGIHNMISTSDGIHFFDYEYAGIDDLSKLIADWVLNPEYPLCSEQEALFIKSVRERLGLENENFWLIRLRDIKPFIAIKWVLIILNRVKEGRLSSIELDKAKKYFYRYQHDRLFENFT